MTEAIRKRGFKTLRELARESLISPTVIHKLIRGGRVRNKTLMLLADVLSVPYLEFVSVVEQHWSAVGESGQKVNA